MVHFIFFIRRQTSSICYEHFSTSTMARFGQLSLKQTFNVRLTLAVLLIAFSQFNFGFDQQGYASTQAMGAFAKQFGEYDPETKEYALPTVWLSQFNGFIYIGQATGMSPPLMTLLDSAARVLSGNFRCPRGKLCQQAIRQAHVYVCHEYLGNHLCDLGNHRDDKRPNHGRTCVELYVRERRFCGANETDWFASDVYIGMELAVVPIYQAEIVPPQARGFIVGTYQTSLYVRCYAVLCYV
jgi:MFS transporter, SP family, sugar:H+ symporter